MNPYQQYRGEDDAEGEDDYGSSGADEDAQAHKRKKNGARGTPLEGKKGKTGKGKAAEGEL